MKTRRTILALVVIVGFVVLLLGITGLLSPRRAQPAASKSGEGAAPKEDVIEEFQIKGDTWLLKAAEARPKEGGPIELVQPTLEVEQAAEVGQGLADMPGAGDDQARQRADWLGEDRKILGPEQARSP